MPVYSFCLRKDNISHVGDSKKEAYNSKAIFHFPPINYFKDAFGFVNLHMPLLKLIKPISKFFYNLSILRVFFIFFPKS